MKLTNIFEVKVLIIIIEYLFRNGVMEVYHNYYDCDYVMDRQQQSDGFT
jgi:hypothetical protein